MFAYNLNKISICLNNNHNLNKFPNCLDNNWVLFANNLNISCNWVKYHELDNRYNFHIVRRIYWIVKYHVEYIIFEEKKKNKDFEGEWEYILLA